MLSSSPSLPLLLSCSTPALLLSCSPALPLTLSCSPALALTRPVPRFWRALRSFDQTDRAKFLQFVTGSSKVPLQVSTFMCPGESRRIILGGQGDILDVSLATTFSWLSPD